MKIRVQSVLAVALIATGGPSALADGIGASGVFPVQIPFKKLFKCADFSMETRAELTWPQNSDSGEGVELAELLGRFWADRFYASYGGHCQDFEALPDVMDGYISYVQRDYTTYDPHEPPAPPQLNHQATLTLRLGVGVDSTPDESFHFVGSQLKVSGNTLEWSDTTTEIDWSWVAKAIQKRVQEKAQSVGSVPHFHVGDIAAIHSAQGPVYPVKILEVAPSGSATILYFSIYDQRQTIGVPLIELGYQVNQTGSFSASQRIRTLDSYSHTYSYATIRQLYSNGLADITYDAGNEMWVDLKGFEPAPAIYSSSR